MMNCGQCGFASEQPFTYCPKCGTHSTGGGEGLAGRILNGKYRILSEIGAGAMGTVYLGEHVSLKKKIALKILHRELQIGDEPLQRFQREGIAAGQITHANVIQIFDFDRTEDGTSYLAMEYVDGENLKDRITRVGAFTSEEALSITTQLLQTLVEAHRHGVVHRDLKPENLMIVTPSGSDVTLKVLDFGLSKLVDRPLDASLQTMSGRVMGTPLYMAPEQWRGEEVDQRSDLYSVSLILYEMLTGHQPFRGSNMTETMMRSATEAPPSVLDDISKYPVPVDLDEILRCGMAKDREERFQNATEMLEALAEVRMDRVQEGSSGGRLAAGRKRRPARTAKRASGTSASGTSAEGGSKRLLAIGGGVAVVAALAVWGLWGGGGDPAGGADAKLISEIAAEDRTELQRGYLSLLSEARDRLRTGEVPSAMAAADKAARQPIADAEAFLVRAQVYQRQRDYDTARLDYQEAAKRRADYAPAVAGLGWLHMLRNEVDAADKQFAAAVAIDAASGPGLAGRAAVMLARGEPQKALDLLQDVAVEYPLVRLYRGEAQLATGKTDAAVQSFVQAKRGDPSLWRAYRGLALAYSQKGNNRAAEQQCVAGLAMVSDAKELRVLQAELLLGQDRFADAVAALRGTGTPDGGMLLIEGIAEQGRGNGQAAIAAWTKALSQGVEEPANVHLLVAMQHAADGRWADVTKHASAAIKLDDGLARAHFHAGIAAFRTANHADAVARLERAVELDGDDLLARYTLGVLYMDYVRRPKDALLQFEAYQAAGGANEKVSGWLRELRK